MSIDLSVVPVRPIDSRRSVVVPGDKEKTLSYCVEHFIATARRAISGRGAFYVALSGGSTPIALFKALASDEQRNRVNWNQVHFFWGDERAVPPEHPDSNYGNALAAGLGKLEDAHLHRMVAEVSQEENAKQYQQEILETVPGGSFDLIILGMGDDGHTASLFPGTPALDETEQWIVAQEVPEKGWRMTFTYPLIAQAQAVVIYVIGEGKSDRLQQVLTPACKLPAAKIGTEATPALWIADTAAAQQLPTV